MTLAVFAVIDDGAAIVKRWNYCDVYISQLKKKMEVVILLNGKVLYKRRGEGDK